MFRVNGCKSLKTGEWKVTFVNDEHLNCSGARGKRGPGAAMVEDVGTSIVANNPTVTARALADIIKSQTGVTLTRRTSSRVKCTAVENTNLASREGFAVLESYLSLVARDCPGSVTDVEVSTGCSGKVFNAASTSSDNECICGSPDVDSLNRVPGGFEMVGANLFLPENESSHVKSHVHKRGDGCAPVRSIEALCMSYSKSKQITYTVQRYP